VGTRSVANGKQAIEQLKQRQAGEKLAILEPLQIDVTDSKSIQAATESVATRYGHVDVLIANSGVFLKNDDKHQEAVDTLDVNYFGVKRTVDAFLPLIPTDGSGVITIVSSGMGAWSRYVSPAEFRGVVDQPNSVADIDALVQQYIDAQKSGEEQKVAAFPDPSYSAGPYGISKDFINAYGQVIARELNSKNIAVSLVCPSYCSTDINYNSGPHSARYGGNSIVQATYVPVEQTGGFWRNGAPAEIVEPKYDWASPETQAWVKKLQAEFDAKDQAFLTSRA